MGVIQGKPLTSGTAARLLLPGYSATVACNPEQYKIRTDGAAINGQSKRLE